MPDEIARLAPPETHNGFVADWASGASYVELMKEHPVSTAGATIGAVAVTAAGAYAAYRWGPSALKAMPRIAMACAKPAAVAGLGIYGTGKLLFADGADTFSGNNMAERGLHALRSASDVGIVAGATTTGLGVLARNPTLVSRGMTALTLSTGSRIGLSFVGSETPDQKPMSQPLAATQHWTVDAPTTGGGTEKRAYDAYVPPGTGSEKLPVVMVFHGVAGGNAQGLMEGETGLDALADEKKFIAVYPVAKENNFPYGLGLAKMQDWNSPGAGLGRSQSTYDDVDYVKSIISDLKNNRKLNIDENAIYALGFSSGGEFANHLRGRMPLAGVGSVHGTVLGTESRLAKNDDTAAVFVVSDNDYFVPRDGGRGIMTLPFSRMLSSEPLKQLDLAREAAGCVPLAVVTQNGRVRTTEYKSPEPGGAFAKMVSIDGGMSGGFMGSVFGRGSSGVPAEHAWDGPGSGGWPLMGEKNRQLDISRMLVDDLLKHKRHAVQPATAGIR